jgi:excisionase family DNA binding protein
MPSSTPNGRRPSKTVRRKPKRVRAKKRFDVETLLVPKPAAAQMLGCGLTKVYELVRDGKLKTAQIGADARVTTESIYQLVANGGA